MRGTESGTAGCRGHIMGPIADEPHDSLSRPPWTRMDDHEIAHDLILPAPDLDPESLLSVA